MKQFPHVTCMKQFPSCDPYGAIPVFWPVSGNSCMWALRLASERWCRGQMNAHVMARSHLTGPNRLPRWVGGGYREFFFWVVAFVRKFNALRIAMRMSQTCCLTLNVDRVRIDVKLMGQVPPKRAQQVTRWVGGRSRGRIFFWYILLKYFDHACRDINCNK